MKRNAKPKASVVLGERTLVRVPLADSRDLAALGQALATLNDVFRDGAVIDAKKNEDLTYLIVTFHTPKKKWIRERVFFARCAEHASLHPAMLEYTALLNRPARKLGGDLCHGDCHPVGSFAIVPLALRDPKYIGALIDHLRSWDMDHESFHPSLIEELLVRHGICDVTLDLLAWRAIESDGQSRENLQQAVRDHGLLAKIDEHGGLEAFVERALRINRRTKYLPLYVGNAGRALFAGRQEDFERWLALFEARGLVFEASDREPPESAIGAHSVPAWPDEFEEDDDTTP